MSAAEQLNFWMVIHGALLAACIPIFLRFCDRSEAYKAALAGVNSSLEALRKRLAEDLRERVMSICEPDVASHRVVSSLLQSDGKTPYVEQPGDPLQSESFRNIIHAFAEDSGNGLASYHAILRARAAWSFWSRAIGWLVYTFLAWQLFALFCLAILGKLCGIDILRWAFPIAVPSAIGTIAFLATLGLSMYWHGRIVAECQNNESL